MYIHWYIYIPSNPLSKLSRQTKFAADTPRRDRRGWAIFCDSSMSLAWFFVPWSAPYSQYGVTPMARSASVCWINRLFRVNILVLLTVPLVLLLSDANIRGWRSSDLGRATSKVYCENGQAGEHRMKYTHRPTLGARVFFSYISCVTGVLK